MTSDHEAWLRLTAEDPIDPEMPICDSHHHLWDGPGNRGRYLLDEYLRDANGHNIVKTIFAECGAMYRKDASEAMRPVGETEFAQGIAAQSASGQYAVNGVAAGIIGYADLTLGEKVAPVLEAHIAVSGNRFRGIRQSCTWDTDPAIISMGRTDRMMSDKKFREGFSCLEKYKLNFDAWQYYTQLTELADLAREFPATTIIVNHTGGPLGIERHAGRKKEVFQEWQKGIRDLAVCTNVVIKLGGLGMARCGFGWNKQDKPPTSVELAEAMAPYYNFCIELFGTDRCMFESNFPVDRESYSYAVLWNAFKLICRDCSSNERAGLFHDTAVRVYRLDKKV